MIYPEVRQVGGLIDGVWVEVQAAAEQLLKRTEPPRCHPSFLSGNVRRPQTRGVNGGGGRGAVDGQTLSGESSPIPTGGIVSAQLEHQALISTMLKVRLSMESHLRDFIDNLVSLPPSPFLLALPLCLFHQISVRLQHVDGTSCVISHASRLQVTLSSPTTGVSSSDERGGDVLVQIKTVGSCWRDF